jgi:hypothetical protein
MIVAAASEANLAIGHLTLDSGLTTCLAMLYSFSTLGLPSRAHRILQQNGN